eukprot:14300774-Alexandrium_andersonii.AAC.1
MLRARPISLAEAAPRRPSLPEPIVRVGHGVDGAAKCPRGCGTVLRLRGWPTPPGRGAWPTHPCRTRCTR